MGLEQGFNRIEDRLRGIAEGLTLRNWKTALKLRLKHARRMVVAEGSGVLGNLPEIFPSPGDLVEEVVLRAIDNAVDWGGGRRGDYPNDFAISVARDAWDAYYGKVACVPQQVSYYASEVMRGATGVGGWTPRIEISCDDLLSRAGYSIDSGFSKGRSMLEFDAVENVPDDAEEELVEDTTPSMPGFAELRFLGDTYHLFSETTLGVRRNNRKLADIVLPTCKHTYYLSAKHAIFSFTDDAWTLTQSGRNETRVVRGDKSGEIILASGDSCNIQSYDRIYFAGCNMPAVFLTPSGEDKSERTVLWTSLAQRAER